ncbi:hypothetical protein CHS0354_041541 [Potamilus streckersoni]|uniref:Uncharacterized protein n=1 Tax=Potamilus streckersoni TaxID=2493646 RepID=A0AAE0WCT5_9BIVA|nr:hypothetical protein CHS0354_041541 [Potamilus streckersoni]
MNFLKEIYSKNETTIPPPTPPPALDSSIHTTKLLFTPTSLNKRKKGNNLKSPTKQLYPKPSTQSEIITRVEDAIAYLHVTNKKKHPKTSNAGNTSQNKEPKLEPTKELNK